MTHSRFLALVALSLAAACTSEQKSRPDSSAVTTTAADGSVLGDTARAASASPTTATTITPAPPSGRPVPSTMPGAPGAAAAAPAAALGAAQPGAPAAEAGVADTAREATAPGGVPAPTQQTALAARAPMAQQRAPIPYSAGERLAYDVKFGSIDVGNAVMEVVGVEEVRDRPAFHVRFNVKGGTLFYKVNDHYESWLDTTTLVSLRHVQDIDEGRYERERHYEIMPERGVYRENDKPEQPTVQMPLDDGSFFFFLRTIPLEVGQTYSFNRYFKPDRNPVTVTVVRKERIKVPAGTFDAIVLHPTIKAKGVFGEGGQAEIWLADDSSRVMLQMKSKLKIGSLNLYLKKLKRGS